MKTQKQERNSQYWFFFSKKWRCKLLKCINCLNCGNCFQPGLDLPSLPALLHYYSIHSFQIIGISFLKKCSPVWFCRQGMFPPRQFAFPQSNGTGESRGATFCRTAPLSPTWSYIYRTPYFCYSTHVPKVRMTKRLFLQRYQLPFLQRNGSEENHGLTHIQTF